jgi:hypothetical protein
MLTRTGAGLQIDAVHTRAICDEVGERLRAMLKDSHELPPRLRDLMERLARLDDEASPSIVPSLDEMTTALHPEPLAAPAIPRRISSR